MKVETYNLIKIIRRKEMQAEASNDIYVTYHASTIEVVCGGVDAEEAAEKLAIITTEMDSLRGVQKQVVDIMRAEPNRDKRTKAVDNFYKNLWETTDVKAMQVNRYNIEQSIKDRMEELAGEYLIIPGIYKQLI